MDLISKRYIPLNVLIALRVMARLGRLDPKEFAKIEELMDEHRDLVDGNVDLSK